MIRWKDRPPGGAMFASSGVKRRATQLLLPTQCAAQRTSRDREWMESEEGRYDGQTEGWGAQHYSADAPILSDLLYRAAAGAASAPPSHNTQTQSHCSVPVTAQSGLPSPLIVSVT